MMADFCKMTQVSLQENGIIRDESGTFLGRLCDEAAYDKIASLTKELETERLRLAACGVAALGYFDGCKDEYRSASLEDVLQLRAKVQELERVIELSKNAEPVAWNQVQVCTWIGNQLMNSPSMFERSEVCRYVRSLGRDETLAKHLHPPLQTSPASQDDVKDAKYKVPEGYALIAIPALKAWGKYDEVIQAACFPINAAMSNDESCGRLRLAMGSAAAYEGNILTREQEKLRREITKAEIASAQASSAYWAIKRQCTNHVYKNDDDEAKCEICGIDGGWWCQNSSDHVCHYTDSEYCIHCGQPEERR